MLNKLKVSDKKVVTTVVTTDVVLDPNGSVMNGAPWSFRLNEYQRDVIEKSADELGISKQAYLRHAAVEYAKTNLGIG